MRMSDWSSDVCSSDLKCDIARAGVQAQHAATAVVDAAGAQFSAAFERRAGLHRRDATVDHVDRATDRAAAVEQGGGALDHFDLVGQERLIITAWVGPDVRYGWEGNTFKIQSLMRT